MTPSLYIELFGGFQVSFGARTLSHFRTQKTAALLAFLVYHKNRSHSREVLVELLWPDAESQSAGRSSLSVALGSLRKQLEPPGIPGQSVLRANTNAIGINPDVTTDVSRFESLLDEAQRFSNAPEDQQRSSSLKEEALTLFKPALLPGFYDDWILPQQVHLVGRAQAALVWLVTYYETQGQEADALRCAGRLLEQGYDSAEERSKEHYLVGLGCSASLAAAAVAVCEASSRSRTPTQRETGSRSRKTANTFRISDKGAHDLGLYSPAPHSNEGNTRPSDASRTPSAQLMLRDRSSRNDAFDFPLTPFFGREQDISRLLRRLLPPDDLPIGENADNKAPARLLTLTGPGGVGKTRLALALAERIQSGWPAIAVNYLPLSGVQDARLLPTILARELNVSDTVDSELAERMGATNPLSASAVAPDHQEIYGLSAPAFSAVLLDTLRSATTPRIVFLDNLEQIADDVAPLLEVLLRQAPMLTFVVTSQVRLAVPGEEEVLVPPLPVPAVPPLGNSGDRNGGVTKESHAAVWESTSPDALLERWPSVALFVNRAQLSQPDFTLTPRNIPFVVSLVARLEGIPLALELAAARAHIFTPAQMLTQITNQRFTFLVNGRRRRQAASVAQTDNVIGRHASLHAAFLWTVRLLSPEVQRFFAGLSVFRGGWTATAAEAVTGEPLALDYLAELCDASLIRPMAPGENGPGATATTPALQHDEGDETRFTLLETIREFAATLLAPFPEQADALHRNHLDHFLHLSDETAPRLSGPSAATYLDRLAADHDNFRAALESALNGAIKETPKGAGAGGGDPFILPSAAAVVVLPGLRLATSLYDFWLIRGHFTEGLHWLNSLIVRAEAEHGEAKEINAVLDERAALIALALNRAGVLAMTQGDLLLAESRYERALDLRRRIGDEQGMAATLNNCAIVACRRQQFDHAHTYYTESLALWRKLNETRHVGTVLANLGSISAESNDLNAAQSYYAESLQIAQSTGDIRGAATRQRNLGQTYYSLHQYERAERLLQESLRALLPLEDARGVAYSLLDLGLVAAACGKTRFAERFMDTALAAFDALGVPLSPFQEDALRKRYPDFRASLPPPHATTNLSRDAALRRLMTLATLAARLPTSS